MLKVAILDDDAIALNISKGVAESFFEKRGVSYSVQCFSSSLTFLSTIKEETFNLVLLDIDMPEKDGISVAKEVKDLSFDTAVIFLSEKENLVFDCFAVHPFGFIRKSKMYDDFFKVMNLFVDKLNSDHSNEEKITFKTNTTISTFKINDIVYIEGNRNYQSIHKRDGEVVNIRVRMRDLEEALSRKGFIRIQKGFLVNHIYIQRIESREVILLNKISLPLSPKFKEEVLKTYLEMTRGEDSLFIS